MSVHLIRGDEPSLVRDAVQKIVDGLVGDGDRGLLVDEHSGDEYEVGALADAAQTPPFLTDKRIVVGRELHQFKADDLGPLVAYLADPLPSTDLVLVWESGAVPNCLLAAVKDAGGEVVDTSPGTRAQDKKAWLQARVDESGLKLDRAAVDALAATVGEDVSRVAGILATLRSTFGDGGRIGVAEVEPYLGEAGGVAPWELTDAIDRGDIPGAIDKLHRMIGSGERHALVVLASLHSHVQRMLALDGAGVGSEKDAAAVLAMKGSTYPAKKALEQGRRLGPAKIAQAVQLLARADLDVRGVRDLPDEVVLEVLVARLAHLGRR
jgi:DNA polymerase-3 subunit delta